MQAIVYLNEVSVTAAICDRDKEYKAIEHQGPTENTNSFEWTAI